MPMLALAELPAASLHEPETPAPPSSGPEYVAEVHEAIPDVASVPAKATATGWLYQPFASGARPGLAFTLGGVPSYLKPKVVVAELPALSVHVPETDAEPLSGPPYVADVQEATPERLSVPENPTPTAWLYQPFESGARAALAVTVGGVASILMGTCRTQHCGDPLTTTVHVKVTPAVSGETVWSPHPCGLLDPAGSTNDTVTEVRYQ